MIIRFHYLDEFYVFFSFLMRDHQAQEKVAGLENGLSISTKHSTAEDSGAIEAVLVNTNQVSSISIDYCVPLVFWLILGVHLELLVCCVLFHVISMT